MAIPDKLDFEGAQKLTERIYKRLDARRADIDKLERYYLGDHKLAFATDAWMEANADRYRHFSDNWCAAVSDAESERIRVSGIVLPDDGARRMVDGERRQDPAVKGLWDDWLRNEMDMQSSQGILQSLNTRRSYVMVWGDDDDEPVVTWEHPSNVEIEYDWMTGRKRLAGIKTWVEEEHEYATLYTRTEVWKFQRDRSGKPDQADPQSVQGKTQEGATGNWEAREFEGWEDDAAYGPNPLGEVPIVEIANRPLLRGEPVSEVAKVSQLQDAINILWAYLMFAADYASMDARVLLGAEPPMRHPIDSQGKPLPPEPITMDELNKARFAIFKNKDAKIDSWKAAELAPFTEVIEIAVSHIAAQTRTPPHYLVSNKGLSNLAADALKAAEIGLVKKVQEFQMFAGPALREVFRLMALVRNNEALSQRLRLAKLAWENAEMRSESQLADALLKKRQMGYPMEWILEQDGVDPSDRNRIMRMIREEEQRKSRAALAGAMTGALEDGDPYGDSGAVPGDAGDGDGWSGSDAGEPVGAGGLS